MINEQCIPVDGVVYLIAVMLVEGPADESLLGVGQGVEAAIQLQPLRDDQLHQPEAVIRQHMSSYIIHLDT